jgi:uncharacterized protein (DUF2164 family)
VILTMQSEQKKKLRSDIQSYFENERGEEIGELAADNFLTFMIEALGPIIYNQAIRDARSVIMQQMERIEEEVYALEQPIDWVR